MSRFPLILVMLLSVSLLLGCNSELEKQVIYSDEEKVQPTKETQFINFTGDGYYIEYPDYMEVQEIEELPSDQIVIGTSVDESSRFKFPLVVHIYYLEHPDDFSEHENLDLEGTGLSDMKVIYEKLIERDHMDYTIARLDYIQDSRTFGWEDYFEVPMRSLQLSTRVDDNDYLKVRISMTQEMYNEYQSDINYMISSLRIAGNEE